MINVKNCSLAFGTQTVFDNISFFLNGDERTALVGRNGAGKTTFLKILAGQQEMSEGTISIGNNLSIAYLPQEVVLVSEKTVVAEALETFPEVARLYDNQHLLEAQLSSTSHPDAELVSKYATVLASLEELNAGKVEAEAKKILMGLGFTTKTFNKKVSELSTGWKMRLLLAKLLLQKADFYLFDEPTNHLDIFAKDWFLDFLKNSSFGFMIVCHERYFLDQTCNRIVELERGNAKVYNGNYTAYEMQKAQADSDLQNAYDQQQREIKQKQITIDRFRAKASKASMAQSMSKSLDKLERITPPASAPRAMNLDFAPTRQPGRLVLDVKDVAHSFGVNIIFENISFDVERGEKIALIAPNGTGKTTLFNVISGIIQRTVGTVEFGYNVDHTIFSQDYNDSLVLRNTVLEEIEKANPHQTTAQVRSALGAFLFPKDEVHKKISVLSGGEKNRVRMVNVLLKHANFLMLDEPTNHLDLVSKEILSKALKNYSGTILFVSHDHDFINALATRVLELTSEGIASYIGNYDDYRFQKGLMNNATQESSEKDSSAAPSARLSGKESYEMGKKSKKLEAKVNKLQLQITELEAKLAVASYGSEEFKTIQATLKQTEAEFATIFAEWDALQQILTAHKNQALSKYES